MNDVTSGCKVRTFKRSRGQKNGFLSTAYKQLLLEKEDWLNSTPFDKKLEAPIIVRIQLEIEAVFSDVLFVECRTAVLIEAWVMGC